MDNLSSYVDVDGSKISLRLCIPGSNYGKSKFQGNFHLELLKYSSPVCFSLKCVFRATIFYLQNILMKSYMFEHLSVGALVFQCKVYIIRLFF